MITIEQKSTTKQVGFSSLYVTFKYNPEIVKCMKAVGSGFFDDKTKAWEFPLTALAKLIDYLCFYDDIEISLLKDKKEENTVYKLSKYKTTPYDYQLDGIQYGLNHDKWLLLDQPGLGKTLQIIYLAEELKKRDGIKHCLIICGVNALKENWKNEIKKHSKLSCCILGERVNRKGKTVIGTVKEREEHLSKNISEFFVITNIETLRNNDIIKKINKGKNKFDMIVVDEVHTCKSPTAQQSANLLKLKSAKYKVAATGTLLLNNPLDTYIPLRWIGADKSTYTNYKSFYCNFGGVFNNEIIGFKNLGYLKYILEKCSIRRTKELLNLPPKTIINEYIEMSDTQQSFYDDIENGVKDSVDKIKLNTTSLLALISRLRQATACPSMLTTKDVPSAKIDRAVDLVNQIVSGGDKVVVFSTFKETANILESKLKEYGVVKCTGDTPESMIAENIANFQSDVSTKVFVGTWQKCGTGLTMTSASYMIFIDTPWTDGAYQQAQDRIHRIGTKSNVTIYNLICKDTIDERVLEIVNDKSALSSYVIDDEISQSGLESLKKYVAELQNM